MRDDLFELTKAFCNYRRAPNQCTVGPMCAIGVCPVLAAAERVVERLAVIVLPTEKLFELAREHEGRKETPPEGNDDDSDCGGPDGV